MRRAFAPRAAAWLACFAVASFAACSGGGDSADPTAPAQGASVTLSPTTASIPIGSSVPLQAQVHDASGQVATGASVFWSSSDTSVATVSSAGVVTGMAVGSAQIAASALGASAVAAITVTNVPVASVVIAPSSGTLTVGGHFVLQVVVADDAGTPLTGRSVVWATSAPQVATVDGNGNVSGIAAGTATITATSEGKSGSATITVAVIPVASVAVSPTSASLTVGQTASLTATALDGSGNVLAGRQFSWTSSNGSIATVSSRGLVTAVGSGSATITAASDGKSASAQVVVAAAPAPPPPSVASVVVKPSSGTLNVGATLSLSATVLDASGNVLTGRSVQWTSSTPNVATVSSGGVVTAVSAGSATITATSQGVSGSAAITVQAPAPPPPKVNSVVVTPATDTLVVGATANLSASVLDKGGNVLTGQTVTWTSSATSVATVTPNGVVTAISAGNATITATSQGVSGSSAITVQPAPPPPPPPPPSGSAVTDLQISPLFGTMKTHATQTFTATPVDANGNVVTGVTVTWSVSDSRLITLSPTAGTTSVVAASNSKRGTVTLTAAVGSVTASAAIIIQ